MAVCHCHCGVSIGDPDCLVAFRRKVKVKVTHRDLDLLKSVCRVTVKSELYWIIIRG